MTGKEAKEKSGNKEKEKKGEERGEGNAEKPGGGAESRKYFCVTCEKVFEVEEGEKPRCPTCMSVHSVEPYVRKGVKLSKQTVRFAAILGVLLVAALAAYFIMEHAHKKKSGQEGSKYGMSRENFVRELEERRIVGDEVVYPFDCGEALGAFAEKAVRGSSFKEKAESLYAAFLEFKNKGGFTPYISRQPRKKEPMTAGEVFAAVKKGGKVPLYSFELAVMFVKAARLEGLHAAVAKVRDYKGLKAPLDPSGNVGHFAAAVYRSDDYEGEAYLFDLHQGKSLPAEAAAFKPLSDLNVAGVFYGHEAFYISGVKFDSTEALAKVEDALSLFASSAELHSLKGLIYIASGGVEEGKQQIRKAMTIEQDAPRMLKWGSILMAEGDVEKAAEEIRRAIDLKERYAMAHATLAMALLAVGEADEARNELDLARKLDPHDPLIPLYEANYYMERGQFTEAIEQAEKALEKSYHDPQVAMLLAALYDQVGERSKMAAVLNGILENENIPDEMKSNIKERFDYEPGEEEEELEDDMGFEMGLAKKGGLLSSTGPSGLSSKPSLGGDMLGTEGELDEEEEEVDPFKLEMGTSKGGLLTGKESDLNLELR